MNVVRLIVDQAKCLFPCAAARESALSAKCTATGLCAEEAAVGEGHVLVADFLAFECARLRLLARAVSGEISWDFVQELTRALSTHGSVDRRPPGTKPNWLMIERHLTITTSRVVPAGRKRRCALQLLAFATAINLRGRSMSPLHVLCEDLQLDIAKHVQRSPRLWI